MFTLISPGGQNKKITFTPIFRKSLPLNIYRNQILKSASITLSNTLSNVHLRRENFPKKYVKVVVLLYPPGLTIDIFGNKIFLFKKSQNLNA